MSIPPLSVSEPDPHRYRQLSPPAPEGPIDLASVLAGEGDIELEVGFGRGRFLIERAVACPNARILGLEVKKKWAYMVAARCDRRGLSNVTAWGADARDVLARVEAGSVKRLFMHFPDPWWKKRHQKRRLVGADWLDLVARVLSREGELFIQTDVEDRAQDQLGALREHSAFELGGQDGLLDHNPYQARSNREVRAEADGLPVYRILALRR